MTTKKPTRRTSRKADDELRPHYDFDYSKSRPNRFASRFDKGSIAVVLDPDGAEVFQTSESVKSFLRSAMRRETRKKRR